MRVSPFKTAGLALALGLAPAWLAAADKPLYTAPQVFQHLLEALESQAYYKAQVLKSEGPVGAEPTQVSKGTLETAAGSRARMALTEPSPGLVVCDGLHLWIELAEVQQVMKYDADRLKASGNFFLDLASSVRHYSKAAYKRLILPGEGFDPEKVTALELLPKRPEAAGFERMRVWVDHRRWTVLRVLMDLDGQRSDVRFSHIYQVDRADVRRDPKLAPDKGLFHYSPPKGFEIFDLD